MNRTLLTSLVFLMLSFSMLLYSFYSDDAVLKTLYAALGFAVLANSLTIHVTSESRSKRAIEVVSMVVALGIVVGGYLLTGNVILGIIASLIAFLMFIAFMLSYALPKLKVRSKQLKFNNFRRRN